MNTGKTEKKLYEGIEMDDNSDIVCLILLAATIGGLVGVLIAKVIG